jgi:hypothetical protein
MNIPDHIFESLETIVWLKILKFFDADPYPGSIIFLTLDPGSGIEIFGSKHPGSATLFPPLHLSDYSLRFLFCAPTLLNLANLIEKKYYN